MEKIIIAAVSSNSVIGLEGRIPWRSAEDFKHFKETTMGFPLIMGRATFLSLGRPLPGRLHIVLSRNRSLSLPEGVLRAGNISAALEECSERGFEKIFFIGGAGVFEEAMQIADKIILSKMKFECRGDRFFPEINKNKFSVSSSEDREEFEIITYERKCLI